jgi:hypothetical protein
MLASRQLLLPFEERPVFGAELGVLSRNRFERYHRERFGRSLAETGLPYERLLANLKLAVHEEDRPWRSSNVGLLLFADQPDAHLTGAYVDIA